MCTIFICQRELKKRFPSHWSLDFCRHWINKSRGQDSLPAGQIGLSSALRTTAANGAEYGSLPFHIDHGSIPCNFRLHFQTGRMRYKSALGGTR